MAMLSDNESPWHGPAAVQPDCLSIVLEWLLYVAMVICWVPLAAATYHAAQVMLTNWDYNCVVVR